MVQTSNIASIDLYSQLRKIFTQSVCNEVKRILDIYSIIRFPQLEHVFHKFLILIYIIANLICYEK